MMDAQAIHDVLVRVTLLLDNGDNRFLNEFGLTRTQYTALQMLDAHHGQRLVDLAAALLCERSTITRVVDRLEEAGFVRRHADAEDRRSQRVVLTPEGVSLREKVKLLYAESVQQRLSTLSNEEQFLLMALLQKLQIGLSEALLVTTDRNRD
jgi:DNA-binding MarR family transcriptional regulator